MEKKIQIIKDNNEVVKESINAYLDSIYELTEKFFDEEGNLKEGLPSDEKAENFIKSIKEDAPRYESLRRKIIDKDFNLSLTEIAMCGLSLMFMRVQFENQIKRMEEVKQKLENIIEIVMDKETQKVDFS